MSKSLQTSPSALSDDALRDVLEELQSAGVDQNLVSGALAIGTSAATKVKNVAAIYALCNGVLVTSAVAENAISGTVSNAAFNVYSLFVDSAGVITAAMGTEGAALGDIVFPAVPANKAMIGFVIVNPTGTGDFVGGTDDLNDATIVPNAVYVDVVGSFNPNLLAL